MSNAASPASSTHGQPASLVTASVSSESYDPVPPAVTLQQRLLTLRNERFFAKSLPGAGYNARHSGVVPLPDQHDSQSPPRDQENHEPPKPRPHGKLYHSTSSLSILDELSNPFRGGSLNAKNRRSNKRPPIPIFQDTPERALLDGSSDTASPFDPVSSSPVESPFRFDHIQDSFSTMGLREVTGNLRGPSLWSSASKPGRRRPEPAASRHVSEEYVQRIERELELAQESVYSPNSNRSWKEKLVAAQAENERLRQELADVKLIFEGEVQKAVQHKTAAEVGLRRKIRSLEEEVEQKDTVIRTLEHDERRHDQGTVDFLKTTIERLEFEKASLEQTNQTISKRNEVLTHLLVLSPTKSQHEFELETPSRVAHKARPRSMLLPRLASSPTHTHPHRPQSLINSPPSAGGFSSSPRIQSPISPTISEANGRFPFKPELSRSQSVHSGRKMHSRNSTMGSCLSTSPTTEAPLSSVSGEQLSRRASSRGTRRFVPGSSQLKPLLLPTLTGEFGALSSVSPMASPTRPPRRDFSDSSIDPTTMFISQEPVDYDLDRDCDTNDTSVTMDSARSIAYQSLEGVLDAQIHHEYFGVLEEPGQDGHIRHVRATSEDPDRTIMPTIAAKFNISRRSADENEGENRSIEPRSPTVQDGRLSRVEVPLSLFSHSQEGNLSETSRLPPESIPNCSRKRRKLSECIQSTEGLVADHLHLSKSKQQRVGIEPIFVDTGTDVQRLSGLLTPPVRSRPTSLSLLSPHRSRGPLELLQRKNFGVRPIAVVTIKTIYGTLSRCTSMVRDFKKDPLALARRVIANAWRCNWAVLGKLSWWVLGLFLGPSTDRRHDRAWNWDDYDGEAIAERQCALPGPSVESDQSTTPGRCSRGATQQHVPFKAAQTSGAPSQPDSRSEQESASPQNVGWGKSLLLWGKFSMAIMLAVSGAVVKGPQEMLKDTDMDRASRRPKDLRRASTTSEEPLLSDGIDGSIEMRSHVAKRTNIRRRRPRRLSYSSPPPSARALLSRQLEGDNLLSPPSASSSPSMNASFRFGRGETFTFDLDSDADAQVETLKPHRPERVKAEDINFDYLKTATPSRAPRGRQEYDPESARVGAFRSTASTPESLRMTTSIQPLSRSNYKNS